MKKKTEVFSSPTAKRVEIEEMLAIARKLTEAGYGDICFTLANEKGCELDYLGERRIYGREEKHKASDSV